MGPGSPGWSLSEETKPGREMGQQGAQGRGCTAGRARALAWAGGLEVALAVQRRGEGHVVQSTRHGVVAGVGGHPSDAVLGLVGRQLSAQLVHRDVVLQRERGRGAGMSLGAAIPRPVPSLLLLDTDTCAGTRTHMCIMYTYGYTHVCIYNIHVHFRSPVCHFHTYSGPFPC